MKRIPLTQGKFALVDDQDYDFLMQWKWFYVKNGKQTYAVRNMGKYPNQRLLAMHRVIVERISLNIGQKHIDHKNGNGLDNQRDNLRVATRSQNLANRGRDKNNRSGYKGVYWNKRMNKWHVQIRVNRKLIHLGYFDDINDAARAYNESAIKYFGEFAVLNNV